MSFDVYEEVEAALKKFLLLFKMHPSVISRMFDLKQRNAAKQLHISGEISLSIYV